MCDRPVFALLYDFDKTLSPRDMQEYAFIPEIGMEPGEFWDKCNSLMRANSMDTILAYMYVMQQESRGKFLLTRKGLNRLGGSVELFDGVESWFGRVNTFAKGLGLTAEHYIISSGLKEIIEGTPVAHEFKEIFAAEFYYNEYGEAAWPALAVNFTSKTQFLFRVNKGLFDVTDSREINEFMPEEKRRVPFRNMIYIGDGYTDVPCMKLVRVNGGHSIAVYQSDRGHVDRLILQGRADFGVKADYSPDSEMEKTVFAILEKAAAVNRTIDLHLKSVEQAKRNLGREGF